VSTRGRRWRPVAQSLSRGVPRGGSPEAWEIEPVCTVVARRAPGHMWFREDVRTSLCGLLLHTSRGSSSLAAVAALELVSSCSRVLSSGAQSGGLASARTARALVVRRCVSWSLRWQLGAFTALAVDAHRGVAALGRARTCRRQHSRMHHCTACCQHPPAAVTLEVLQTRLCSRRAAQQRVSSLLLRRTRPLSPRSRSHASQSRRPRHPTLASPMPLRQRAARLRSSGLARAVWSRLEPSGADARWLARGSRAR